MDGEAIPGDEKVALPLTDGYWRAAVVADDQAQTWLKRQGWQPCGLLADGSGRYLRLPPANAATERAPNPAAARVRDQLEQAVQAIARPLPTPQFLAILNLSEDSFSDGHLNRMLPLESSGHALRYRAQCLVAEGATMLDLGAESTRPGAAPVAAEAQLAKLLPAIEALTPLDIPLSVDTRSAEVAARCLAAGAAMINDVSGLSDPDMAAVLASAEVPVVLMHMRGTPTTMQEHCHYRHLLGEIADELGRLVERATAAGIARERLILDPGIGFAKDAEQSRRLVAEGGALRALGLPLLFGPSRKSFMADILPQQAPHRRDGGTAGAAALCAAQGATWLRLHRGGWVWESVKVAAACAAQAHAARWAAYSPPEALSCR